MPIFIGQRDDRIATTSGHIIHFKAGEESFVPGNDKVIEMCIQRGHVLKKEEVAVKKEEPVKKPVLEK